jgi:hypothetical protein
MLPFSMACPAEVKRVEPFILLFKGVPADSSLKGLLVQYSEIGL